MYTTLEPCSIRKPGKTPCADRLINGKVARVVYGMADKDETVYGHSSLSEAGVEIGLFPNDLIRELLVLNKPWSDTRRKPEVMPPSNGSSPLSSAEYYKPGTSVADKVRLFVRPPKGEAGLYTIENSDNRVLAFGRTLEEIAVKWRQIDSQKVIVEKMQRVGSFNTDQRLALI